MFIELTSLGITVTVNLNQVVMFYREDDGKATFIMTHEHNNKTTFDQSYEQVKRLIKDEVAAERGY